MLLRGWAYRPGVNMLTFGSWMEINLLLTCLCVCSVAPGSFETPWTVAHQSPLSMGFSQWEYWSGLPFPSPEDLPDLGIKLTSSASPAMAGRFFTSEPEGRSQWTCLLISIFSGTQVTKFVVFKFPSWLFVITKLFAETGGINYNDEMGVGAAFWGLTVSLPHLLSCYRNRAAVEIQVCGAVTDPPQRMYCSDRCTIW